MEDAAPAPSVICLCNVEVGSRQVEGMGRQRMYRKIDPGRETVQAAAQNSAQRRHAPGWAQIKGQ